MNYSSFVFASKNSGKIKEIEFLVRNFPVNIKTLYDFDLFPSCEETEVDFLGNSFQKALSISTMTNLPVIADDSGLVIPILGGIPGVYSYRYGGKKLTDFEKCKKILKDLDNCSDRKAYFKCILSIFSNNNIITYEGMCTGRIINNVIGENGFGYDSIFCCDGSDSTFAQISVEEKNKISHRGIALKKFAKDLKKIFRWIDN